MKKIITAGLAGLFGLLALAAPATAAYPKQDSIKVATPNPTLNADITFDAFERHGGNPGATTTIQLICEQPVPYGGIVYWEIHDVTDPTFTLTPDAGAPFVMDINQPANCAADLIVTTRQGQQGVHARVEFQVGASL